MTWKFLVISAFYSEYGDRTQDVAVVPGGFFFRYKVFVYFRKKYFCFPRAKSKLRIPVPTYYSPSEMIHVFASENNLFIPKEIGKRTRKYVPYYLSKKNCPTLCKSPFIDQDNTI